MIRTLLKIRQRLREMGVLGLNSRNAQFILPNNERRYYPLVDDKVKTKGIFQANQIPVPTLYGVLHSPGELPGLDQRLRQYRDFVIKPARGSGGRGVLVIVDHQPDRWTTASGNTLSNEDVRCYVADILSGLYSLSGTTDKALVEYRVQCDPIFNAVAYRGVPDIRIILYRKFPVMAMLRLPTKRSGGRANLHQGAIGVGIDLDTGRTVHAVHGTSPITAHPDTQNSVIGLTVPRWEECLLVASRIAELVPLGYMGVDIVLDEFKGPMVLELNARPGLAIQLANNAGLGHRLAKIDSLAVRSDDPVKRVAEARDWFTTATQPIVSPPETPTTVVTAPSVSAAG